MRRVLAVLFVLFVWGLAPAVAQGHAHHHPPGAYTSQYEADGDAAAQDSVAPVEVAAMAAPTHQSMPCHGGMSGGATCCCATACAALIAPATSGVMPKAGRRIVAGIQGSPLRGVSHLPPLPPPRV